MAMRVRRRMIAEATDALVKLLPPMQWEGKLCAELERRPVLYHYVRKLALSGA